MHSELVLYNFQLQMQDFQSFCINCSFDDLIGAFNYGGGSASMAY